MLRHAKLVLAALTAALLLAVAAGPASADNALSAEPSETSAVFEELTFGSPLGNVICEVTLHVTFHESVNKVPGELAGEIEVGVSTGSCTNGDAGLNVGGQRVTGLQGPYHIQYNSFEGTLPNINSVTAALVGLEIWITLGSTTCNANETISGTTTGGNPADGLSTSEEGIGLIPGSFACLFMTGELIGTAGADEEITITLL